MKRMALRCFAWSRFLGILRKRPLWGTVVRRYLSSVSAAVYKTAGRNMRD